VVKLRRDGISTSMLWRLDFKDYRLISVETCMVIGQPAGLPNAKRGADSSVVCRILISEGDVPQAWFGSSASTPFRAMAFKA
jgi:hypothetical protein